MLKFYLKLQLQLLFPLDGHPIHLAPFFFSITIFRIDAVTINAIMINTIRFAIIDLLDSHS